MSTGYMGYEIGEPVLKINQSNTKMPAPECVTVDEELVKKGNSI
jgi:hypothetical protein